MDPTSSDPKPIGPHVAALFRDLGLLEPASETDEARAARIARLREQFAAEELREEARFPEFARECGCDERTGNALAALHDTLPLRSVTAWLATGETFCLLLGGRGSGKTVAAATALALARVTWGDQENLRRWSFSRSHGMFVRANDLARSLHRDGELLQRAAGVRVLVLDDLGTEYSDLGERWLSEVDELIAARHGGYRRTVITTNLSGQQLADRYGERVRSRVKGSGRVVFCGEKDLRLIGTGDESERGT